MYDGVLLIGMPGSGKSTLGACLAKRLSYEFIDIDKVIEEKEGLSIPQIFEAMGEEYFRKKESDACINASSKSSVVISAGGGIVKNTHNMDAFNKFLIVFINRPLELIMSDIDTDSRPLLQEGKEKLIELYRERIDSYRTYSNIELVNDGTLEEITEELLYKIKQELKNSGELEEKGGYN
ncbi:shikimate kinase [Clostridium cavendishii DSM 21758]|uniref:Shikimate kinase n=1 Tax=Clostridium cavendishii DSM 21758 TaxID=1121302 RepID=A0A1M6MY30_9CLOT|nr:shikimate kinase [Clostridium cavendishii]SHJ88314.1 shikimate kinase [Clostridium cavendishii DSM 21758]